MHIMAFVNIPGNGNIRTNNRYMLLSPAMQVTELFGEWRKNVNICMMPKVGSLSQISMKII